MAASGSAYHPGKSGFPENEPNLLLRRKPDQKEGKKTNKKSPHSFEMDLKMSGETIQVIKLGPFLKLLLACFTRKAFTSQKISRRFQSILHMVFYSVDEGLSLMLLGIGLNKLFMRNKFKIACYGLVAFYIPLSKCPAGSLGG
jgi:hypothetical protein